VAPGGYDGAVSQLLKQRQELAEKAVKDAKATRIVGAVLLVSGLLSLGLGAVFVWERLEQGRLNVDGALCTLLIGVPLTWAGLKRMLRPSKVPTEL
jgi:hypothetical protein